MVTPLICANRLGLEVLCNSAASKYSNMGRTEDHLHPRKAAVMATLLFALSVPAIAIPTVPHHIAHHAAPAVSTHRRAVAHTQKAAVKTKSSRHHAAAAAEPDSAAKVHEWEAAHHGAAPAVRTKKVKPQSAKAVAHPAA